MVHTLSTWGILVHLRYVVHNLNMPWGRLLHLRYGAQTLNTEHVGSLEIWGTLLHLNNPPNVCTQVFVYYFTVNLGVCTI